MSAQTTTQLCDMLANLLDQSRDREEALEEEVLRLEALVRAKDETLGELLELCRSHYEWRMWWDEEDQCHAGGFERVNR